MKKINKKLIGTACFAAMMMLTAVGCDKLDMGEKKAEKATEATEATTAKATESTAISQRTLKDAEYTDISGSYTLKLPEKREWKTLDEQLDKTSLASDLDLIEIENITEKDEVKQALKDIPTLKKSLDGYIKKQLEEQKEGLYEDAEVVNRKLEKESETVGHYYYTIKIDDDVYKYATFFGTFTNDHVVLVSAYTEGGNKTRKALEESVRSLKLIEQK